MDINAINSLKGKLKNWAEEIKIHRANSTDIDINAEIIWFSVMELKKIPIGIIATPNKIVPKYELITGLTSSCPSD